MSIPDTWRPENWDALTLAWLKRPDGAQALALIRAAPDLLAACKAALAKFDEYYESRTGSVPEAMALLRAAIARAESRDAGPGR